MPGISLLKAFACSPSGVFALCQVLLAVSRREDNFMENLRTIQTTLAMVATESFYDGQTAAFWAHVLRQLSQRLAGLVQAADTLQNNVEQVEADLVDQQVRHHDSAQSCPAYCRSD